jgi:ribosomal protein S18 acetylase RimI-like enzyme
MFELLGADFSEAAWNAENYALPMHRKRELSFVVTRDRDVLGCWVATEKIAGDAHTHRVVIDPRFRKQGLFQRLFCASWRATAVAGLRRMLGETRESNTVAIDAYRSVGLTVMTAEQVAEYLQARGRSDTVDGRVIVDEQGLRFVGIVSTPEHGLEPPA